MESKLRLFESRGLATALLFAVLAWSLSALDWGRSPINTGGLSFAGQFFGAVAHPELSGEFLSTALKASWRTVTFAMAGMTLAIALGLPLGALASGTLTRSARARFGSVVGVRLSLGVLRSIHELVWAWLFVVALGLSPMAGILALAIPYGGILGRIYAEILQDVPQEPLRALRSTGASEVKVFLYGRLPMALPDMLSYTFYRLECAIRSAAILSFVGIPGLGRQIQLSMDDLLYGEVWTLLFFMVGLILVVDWWSTKVRQRLAT